MPASPLLDSRAFPKCGRLNIHVFWSDVEMTQFHIVNESTDDTLATTDNLADAIRLAREAARQGPAGDPVCVLESGGKSVRQFVLMPDGSVVEQAIGRPAKSFDAAPP
jgi:hypothetical protein